VKKFAAKGAKVAVLDVLELTYPKRTLLAALTSYGDDLLIYNSLTRIP